jgi:hypothetical protein
MRSINILGDIQIVLRQFAIAIPEVFLNYDVDFVELIVDDCDRPTVFDIVFVESEDTELVIGEIVLSEDFTASFEIFSAD